MSPFEAPREVGEYNCYIRVNSRVSRRAVLDEELQTGFDLPCGADLETAKLLSSCKMWCQQQRILVIDVTLGHTLLLRVCFRSSLKRRHSRICQGK